MPIIKHRFLSHQINSNTEILIIGTFNPDANGNEADFFYGRERNYLWRLLPNAFGEDSLKSKGKSEKLEFIYRKKIDFIDIISTVDVDNGQETNYKDNYIDGKVMHWRNILCELDILKNIKRVCFTRKTFSDIPEMKKRIAEVQKYCQEKNILFQCLKSPAKFYSIEKQEIWTKFLINDL